MESKKKRVTELLIENPGLLSRELACEDEVKLSDKELQEIYRQIKGKIQPVDERTLGKPRFFRRVLEADVLPDRSRLEKFKKKEFVFPDMLELHLGKTCPCACRFCYRWLNREWRKGDLGLYSGKDDIPSLLKEDVISLLHEFKENGGKQLYLSGGLEFFTSDMAEDVIKSAAELGLIIRAYTNGASDCFDKEEFLDLILDKVEYIRFSLHAIKPDTYAELQMPHRDRKKAKEEFKKVKERIIKMVKKRNLCEDSSKKAKIYIAFLVTKYNFLELKEAIDVWKEIGIDSFDVRVDMRETGGWFNKKQERDLERIMDEIRVQKEKGIYNPMKVSGERHELRHQIKLPEDCFIPFKKPTVDPWGFVYTCCYRAHPSLQHPNFELGNLHKKTLRKILEKAHSNKIIPLKQCAHCSDWELDYNRCIEKVITDWKDGFPPESLPFVVFRTNEI